VCRVPTDCAGLVSHRRRPLFASTTTRFLSVSKFAFSRTQQQRTHAADAILAPISPVSSASSKFSLSKLIHQRVIEKKNKKNNIQ